MFTQNEMFCVQPVSYGFSNTIKRRIDEENSDLVLEKFGKIESSKDRNVLINFLKNQTDDVLEKLHLTKADTGGLHDVVHGGQPLGDFYFSDMITGLYDISREDFILDFGCSTGRVIRNLRSAFEFNAFGCDPRADSISFNKANFKDVTWFQSNEAPPIQEYHSNTYDLVFAISVWSHFSPQMAKEWFDEFHKLMSSGGKIIFTTHGARSVYHFHSKLKKMDDSRAEERLNCLRSGGFHYMPYPSGSDLDNSHWGMAFISRKWFEKELGDKWLIQDYHPGMAMENQDVYVIEAK